MSDPTNDDGALSDVFSGVPAPAAVDGWRQRAAPAFRRRRSWSGPIAGVAAVAVVAAGLGAYLGIRASGRGGPAGTGAAVPAPRDGAALAYDAATGTLVLFGGQGTHGPLDDTWTWDGSGWTVQHPGSSPPAGGGDLVAYDQASHDVLLLTAPAPYPIAGPSGAVPATPPASQTWLWDGSTWHQHTGAQPPGGWQARMATDVASGHVILVTGFTVAPQPEMPCDAIPSNCLPIRDIPPTTWEWTGAAWRDTGAAVPQPTASSTTSFLVTDPSSGQVDDIAISSAIAITPVCANPAVTPPVFPAPAPGAPAGHPQGSTILLTPPPIIGTATAAPAAPPPALAPIPCQVLQGGVAQPAFRPQTTISHWTGSAWSAVKTFGAPDQRAAAAGTVVADPATNRLVFIDFSDGTASSFDGAAWTHLSGAIPVSTAASAVYDGSRRQVVLFGGFGPPGLDKGVPTLSSETWTWDGATWRQHGGSVVPAGAPGGVTGSSPSGSSGVVAPSTTSIPPPAPS